MLANPFEEISTRLGRLESLLGNLHTQPPTVLMQEEDKPMNVEQAAKYLHMSKSAVYQNIDKIPHRKRFNRLYFFKSELRDFLDHGKA